MFKNLRVGLKLALGFLVMIAIMVAVVVIGLRSTSGLYDITNDITDNAYPKVQIANDLTNNLDDVRRVVRDMIIVTDEKELKSLEEQKQAINKTSEDLLKKMEPLLNEPEEHVLYKETQDGYSAFSKVRDEVIDLGRSNKTEEATTLLYGKFAEVVDVYDKKLNDMIELQEKSFDESAKLADSDYEFSKVLMASLLFGAVLVSVGVAFVLTRAITRPLGVAVSTANRLSEGDLAVQIEVDSKDETGLLLQAMKNMVGRLSSTVADIEVRPAIW